MQVSREVVVADADDLQTAIDPDVAFALLEPEFEEER